MKRSFLLSLLEAGLEAPGVTKKQLSKLPASEPWKVAIARALWELTTVDMKWLASKLQMRSAANASQQIRRYRQQPTTMPKPLKQWINPSRNVA